MGLSLAETPKDRPVVRAAVLADPGEEAALLGRVASGDTEAFRAAVRRHLPALLASARRIVLDESEAEDLAQEALLRLWRGAGGLEIGRHGLRPWLRRVVTNLAIDLSKFNRVCCWNDADTKTARCRTVATTRDGDAPAGPAGTGPAVRQWAHPGRTARFVPEELHWPGVST